MKNKILAFILSGCMLMQNTGMIVRAAEPVTSEVLETAADTEEPENEYEGEDSRKADMTDVSENSETDQEKEDAADRGEEDLPDAEAATSGDGRDNQETDAAPGDGQENQETNATPDDGQNNQETDAVPDEVQDAQETDTTPDTEQDTQSSGSDDAENMTNVSENSEEKSTEEASTEGSSSIVNDFRTDADITGEKQSRQDILYAEADAAAEADIYAETESGSDMQTLNAVKNSYSGKLYFGYTVDDDENHLGTLQQYLSAAETVALPHKLGNTYMVEVGEGVFAGMNYKDPSYTSKLPKQSTEGLTNLKSGEEKILEQLNSDRIKEGLIPLVMDTTLRETAKNRTLDMFNNDYFDARRENGKYYWELMRDCGYPEGAYCAENIAYNSESADKLYKQWNAAKELKENMFNESFRSAGIGIYKDKDGKIIGTQIFSDIIFQNITSVTIDFGYEKIGSRAFANCSNLKSVTIPSSVLSIADDAFSGCNKLTIKGKKGSYAETYAKNKSINFVAVNEKFPIDKFGFDEDNIRIEAGEWDHVGLNINPAEYRHLVKVSYEEKPAKGSGKVAEYTADSGTVHALSEGTFTIKAKLIDEEKTCVVTVEGLGEVNITNISMYDDELALYEGESIKPAYKIQPVNATDKLRFTTSDSSVFTVDGESGIITANKAGKAVFTVSGIKEDGAVSVSASVDVRVLKGDETLTPPDNIVAVTNITPTLAGVKLPDGFSWKEPQTKLKADNDKPVQYFMAQYEDSAKNIRQDCAVPVSVSAVSGIIVEMDGLSLKSGKKLSLSGTYELKPTVQYVGAKVSDANFDIRGSVDRSGILDIQSQNDGALLMTPKGVGKCNVSVELKIKERLDNGDYSYGPVNAPYGTYVKKYSFSIEDASYVNEFAITLPEEQEGVELITDEDGTAVRVSENATKFYIKVEPTDAEGKTQNTKLKFTADKRGVVKVSAVKGQNGVAEVKVKKTGDAVIYATAQDAGKRSVNIAVNVKQVSPKLNTAKYTLNKYKPQETVHFDLKAASDNPISSMAVYEDKDQKNVSNIFEIRYNAASASYDLGFKDTKVSNVKKTSYKLYLKTDTQAGEYTYPFTVKLKNARPSLKLEQGSAINLFYLDAETGLKINSSLGRISKIVQKNVAKSKPHFETEFEKAEDGSWSGRIYPVGVTRNNYKNVVKSIELDFYYSDYKSDGNDYIITKKLTVKSSYKQPSLAPAPAQPVIYSKTGNYQSVFQIKDKSSGNILVMGGEENVSLRFAENISDKVRLTYNEGEEDVYLELINTKKKSVTAKILVSNDNWREDASFKVKLTVSSKTAALSLDKSSVLLNSTVAGNEVYNIKAYVSRNSCNEIVRLKQVDVVGTGSAADRLLDEGKITILPQKNGANRSLKVCLNDTDVKNGAYKYKIYAWWLEDGSIKRLSPATLTVKVTNRQPSATVKTKGKIAVSGAQMAGIICTPGLSNIEGTIKSAYLCGEYASRFVLTKSQDGAYNIKLRENSSIEKGKYKLYLNLTLHNGLRVRSKVFTIKI